MQYPLDDSAFAAGRLRIAGEKPMTAGQTEIPVTRPWRDLKARFERSYSRALLEVGWAMDEIIAGRPVLFGSPGGLCRCSSMNCLMEACSSDRVYRCAYSDAGDQRFHVSWGVQ